MKRTIAVCLLLVFILVILGCAAPSRAPISTAVDPPILSGIEPLATVATPNFKYIVVQEAGNYYVHKIKSWSTDENIIIFKCPICGNTIRIPEANCIMYEKVSIKSAWQADVNVCGGTTNDWQDLLGK